MNLIHFKKLRLSLHFQESLKKCLAKKDVDYLQTSFAQYNTSNFDVKSTLDQTFREFLFRSVFQTKSCIDFVELSVQAVRSNFATSALPILLLGDIFDAVTLDECEKLFAYVEDKVGKFIGQSKVIFVIVFPIYKMGSENKLGLHRSFFIH